MKILREKTYGISMEFNGWPLDKMMRFMLLPGCVTKESTMEIVEISGGSEEVIQTLSAREVLAMEVIEC